MPHRVQAAKERKALGSFDLIMLGFGSIIGAGFFVATGSAVHVAGPAILIAFVIGGIALIGVLHGLSEMAVADPDPGGFRAYANTALGPWIGFSVGWMYWTSGVLTMSSEVTAAALLSRFWLPHIPLWVLSLVISALVTGMNFMDTRGFGKIEDGLSAIKVVALVGFIAVGGYAIARGLGAGLHGFRAEPSMAAAFFPSGLRGLAASMLMVMFSYAGVQVVAMAAPDARDPARTIPRANRTMLTSLLILYLASFAVLLMLLPWNRVGTQSSPFVQALQGVGLTWIGPVMNLVILIAALSAVNSSLYGVARMLYALAKDREAPGLFLRESRSGNPTWAVGASALVLVGAIVLAYLLPQGVYLLVTSASGFISMFNWVIIAITHLRYRPMLEQQGKLTYRAGGFPLMTYAVILVAGGVLLTTPLAPGQTPGLIVGVAQFILISIVYLAMRSRLRADKGGRVVQTATPEPVRRDDGKLKT